jgi:AraC family transcriptional activator of tynA and feaB
MAPQFPTRHWSTATVPAQERLAYWADAVSQCFLGMEARASVREGFEAALSSQPLHTLRINHVVGSAQVAARTRRGIASGRDNYYYLLCKERSACAVQQLGRTERLLPGDLALLDSREACEMHFPDGVDVWSLQLPIAWLDTWLPDARRQLARRVDGRNGLGLALSSFVRELGARPDWHAGLLPEPVLADQLGGLLALTLGAPQAPAPRDLAARLDAVLAERCGEPGLNAADVAQALGLSVRTLHRALAGASQTFGTRLLHHRMQAAQRMLSSAAFDRLTLAEVGHRAGVSDASHFSRLCKKALGATPGELRARRAARQG